MYDDIHITPYYNLYYHMPFTEKTYDDVAVQLFPLMKKEDATKMEMALALYRLIFLFQSQFLLSIFNSPSQNTSNKHMNTCMYLLEQSVTNHMQ